MTRTGTHAHRAHQERRGRRVAALGVVAAITASLAALAAPAMAMSERPIANPDDLPDSPTLRAGEPFALPVINNDERLPDMSGYTIELVTQPRYGAATVNAADGITYTTQWDRGPFYPDAEGDTVGYSNTMPESLHYRYCQVADPTVCSDPAIVNFGFRVAKDIERPNTWRDCADTFTWVSTLPGAQGGQIRLPGGTFPAGTTTETATWDHEVGTTGEACGERLAGDTLTAYRGPAFGESGHQRLVRMIYGDTWPDAQPLSAGMTDMQGVPTGRYGMTAVATYVTCEADPEGVILSCSEPKNDGADGAVRWTASCLTFIDGWDGPEGYASAEDWIAAAEGECHGHGGPSEPEQPVEPECLAAGAAVCGGSETHGGDVVVECQHSLTATTGVPGDEVTLKGGSFSDASLVTRFAHEPGTKGDFCGDRFGDAAFTSASRKTAAEERLNLMLTGKPDGGTVPRSSIPPGTYATSYATTAVTCTVDSEDVIKACEEPHVVGRSDDRRVFTKPGEDPEPEDRPHPTIEAGATYEADRPGNGWFAAAVLGLSVLIGGLIGLRGYEERRRRD